LNGGKGQSDAEARVVFRERDCDAVTLRKRQSYHCHIIQHEDQGMMSNILVIDPNAPPAHITMCQTTP
jgi:hypothetical protein